MGPIERAGSRNEISGRVDRRRFLRRLGATSALGGAALLGGHEALHGSGLITHAQAQEGLCTASAYHDPHWNRRRSIPGQGSLAKPSDLPRGYSSRYRAGRRTGR